ncbi:MAG: GTP 3',8-cyclase MoaA [Alphaproteobacteria bacterium]
MFDVGAMASFEPLIDPFGRRISYLRVSVTDRCDFRCVYCMAEDMTFLPKAEILSLEELDRLCTAFIAHGVRKLRLTGGEPLVRRNVMDLIQNLGRHLTSGDLDELTLTTNGSQLAQHADNLIKAGVRRINISLDTLNPAKFTAITRWGQLTKVLNGLQAAKEAGLAIKLNMVALKDINDDEFDTMIKFCGAQGFDLTLIEVMPMGDIGSENRIAQYLPLSQIRCDLERRWHLTDLNEQSGGPARYVRIEETGGKLGFITPLTHNFCEGCNRVRLTCTGTLYMCLGQEASVDLRTPLRASSDDMLLHTAIKKAIYHKPKGHDFIIDRHHQAPAVARHMNVTGG